MALGEEGAVMTTLDDVTKKKAAEQSAEQQAAVERGDEVHEAPGHLSNRAKTARAA